MENKIIEIISTITKINKAELVEKVDSLEINQLNLASQQNSLLESQKILEQSLDDLGLSVVDGLLNITWNDEEANYQ